MSSHCENLNLKVRRIMTIEHELKRIADALENTSKPAPVTQTEEKVQSPEPEPETEHVPTLDDVRAAVEQFLPDRRDEAVALMKGFGAEKIGDFKPEQFSEVIAKFNADFNS